MKGTWTVLAALPLVACSSTRDPSSSEATATVEQATTSCEVSLTRDPKGPQNQGTVVTWVAEASCVNHGNVLTPEYEFHLKPSGGTSEVVQRYSTSNTWRWGTGTSPEGTYEVTVAVHAKSATIAQAHASRSFSLLGLPPPTCNPGGCNPIDCGQLGENCGVTEDGCCGFIQCGYCAGSEVCGGGGFNECGAAPCVPQTCQDAGITCGLIPDGCGNFIDCTTTCATKGYDCGQVADGCGNMIDCGTCTAPQYCGGGGWNVCGGNSGLDPDGSACDKPTTCAKLGYDCGTAADGCGGVLQCGTCPAGQTCGGGGYDVCG